MKFNIKHLSLYFFLICVYTISYGQPTQRMEQKVQASLDSLQRANGFPGVTCAILLPSGKTLAVASGVADSLKQTPMHPNHRMLAGSIGKTFFAAAAMVLAEKGVFNLDDKIETFIGGEPWFSRIPNARTITMRMLLNHTSGIEEYYELGDFMERLKNHPEKVWTPLETIAYIFDRKPLFAAGEGWGYADANYLIMGYILEKITGQRMYALAKQYALKPYKLNATEPSLKLSFKQLATGYSAETSPFPFHGPMVKNDKLVFNPQFEWTGGGFVSSATDLAKWMKELYHYSFISEANREQMRMGVAANTGKEHRYGLGLQIRPSLDFGWSYGHSGWFPGYVSDAAYFPEAKISIALQFNTDNGQRLRKQTYSYLVDLMKLIKEDM
ncbi:MAG TPA: serine hydrolase domain-containing protein [Flavisolibacter sp.]|nr:serine hydrolase domain-containing protein [Flavisolibacter sp.]